MKLSAEQPVGLQHLDLREQLLLPLDYWRLRQLPQGQGSEEEEELEPEAGAAGEPGAGEEEGEERA